MLSRGKGGALNGFAESNRFDLESTRLFERLKFGEVSGVHTQKFDVRAARLEVQKLIVGGASECIVGHTADERHEAVAVDESRAVFFAMTRDIGADGDIQIVCGNFKRMIFGAEENA